MDYGSKALFNFKENFRNQQEKKYPRRKKSKSVWVEICIMNHNARVFQIILLITRITFTLTHVTKG